MTLQHQRPDFGLPHDQRRVLNTVAMSEPVPLTTSQLAASVMRHSVTSELSALRQLGCVEEHANTWWLTRVGLMHLRRQ